MLTKRSPALNECESLLCASDPEPPLLCGTFFVPSTQKADKYLHLRHSDGKIFVDLLRQVNREVCGQSALDEQPSKLTASSRGEPERIPISGTRRGGFGPDSHRLEGEIRAALSLEVS